MFKGKTVTLDEKKLPNGRKYKLTLIALLLLVAGFALTTMNPLLTKVYAEFAGGLIGILLVYCGGNVSNKWVLGKSADHSITDPDPVPPVVDPGTPVNPPDNEMGG